MINEYCISSVLNGIHSYKRGTTKTYKAPLRETEQEKKYRADYISRKAA